MNTNECLLALDLGTTTCRCLAFDTSGHVLAEASREVTLHCPAATHAEADPAEWWDASQAVIQKVMSIVRSGSFVPVAMGLAGLKHAVVALDEEGRLLGRTMLWMDQRCHPQVEWLNTQESEAVERIHGPDAQVTATPSLAKLRWLSENEPELVQETQCYLLPKDYIRYRLTGTMATDPADAGGTMMYDQRTGTWSPAMVALAGIDMAQLPPIRPSSALAGVVSPEGAQATGLPEGLPVVIGMADVQATMLGLGSNQTEQTVIYLGTAAWIGVQKTGARFKIRATATTGAALRWLRDLVGGSYEELVAEAAEVPAGADGLLFLPHLCGERAPFFRPDLRGRLLGLSIMHGRGHLAQALLEGCSCHLRWLTEGFDDLPRRILVAGGGAKSAHWVQTLADILGASVWVPECVEAGAMGAALLASVGSGIYESEAEAVAGMVRLGRRYDAQEATRTTYEEVYSRYRRAEADLVLARS